MRPCEVSQTGENHPEEKRTVATWLHRLKERWGVGSLYQVLLILLVFSLAGMSVVFCRKWLFMWLGFDAGTADWIKAVTYLVLLFPCYQALLLVYGALLGQFSFFWEKEKKLARWVLSLFTGKSQP